MSNTNGARVRRALQGSLVNAVLGNERIARELGLLVTDLQTLHLLVLREDTRTPKQLSQATGLPTSTVTRVLDRLEQAGYIRRGDDPRDRRKVRIELVADKIDAITSKYDRYTDILETINSDFTEKELGVVARYLERSAETF